MYYKIINYLMVFSDCKTILLDYDHPELGFNAGQWVSNPSTELIAADMVATGVFEKKSAATFWETGT